MGGVVTGLMAVVVAAASANGHHVYPVDAIGHFLIGWMLVPAVRSSQRLADGGEILGEQV